jgi:hypothetical protein
MKDSQKEGSGVKSGGQRIDDHSFWAGGKGSASVFPDGPHKVKMESSAEGAGSLPKYEDTTEAIKKSQVDSVKQVKSHQGRLPEWRN